MPSRHETTTTSATRDAEPPRWHVLADTDQPAALCQRSRREAGPSAIAAHQPATALPVGALNSALRTTDVRPNRSPGRRPCACHAHAAAADSRRTAAPAGTRVAPRSIRLWFHAQPCPSGTGESASRCTARRGRAARPRCGRARGRCWCRPPPRRARTRTPAPPGRCTARRRAAPATPRGRREPPRRGHRRSLRGPCRLRARRG